ncbi:alpha/beta hydrolase [Nitrogeniibacter mangrovi]|uniref:Alpha/beta hydrolase n=1 Tax=Nitrogeniibacter mangrovi TaxID=2016596 RepID=A0A6C1B4H5_9RHOO|nr:alpha/beta hydrolase [Nitrogeniibacter mangrovi]QID17909.1 alpha/beta hydrolase [Nitrogeniibacter mangrovi]
MTSDTLPTPDDARRCADGRDGVVDVDGGAPVPVRIYGDTAGRPGALVVHFHGGTFVAGSLDSGATVAGLLAQAGAVVVSVDYPLAGAHPFPAAVDVGYAVLKWADGQRCRLAGKQAGLFVAGEEAGGNLAAAIAMVARDRRAPGLAGQLLISPMLDARLGTASMRKCEAGPVGCRWADGWRAYLGCGTAADHPYALPARARRLGGLAPALVLTAGDDPFHDEALAYATRLEQAGVFAYGLELEAHTGWPCSLSAPPPAPATWAVPMREAMRAFMVRNMTTEARQRVCDTRHSMQSQQESPQ